ncbi:acetyl-CoA carboxylase, carboxyltransferase subunit beta [Hominifimenecus sp. rT4P-3]|uniref:acetyl-CoA carboxylase, carboxyltransferase subunit beta n=1 Tax=Hominifimenecus sp. rT4P-3 TaxID=3242979 RepID=UPI003DA47ADE
MLKDLWGKKPAALRAKKSRRETEETELLQGLWTKCGICGNMVYKDEVRANSYICPKCHGYFRLKAHQRLRMIADKGSFESWDGQIEEQDPLDFPGYREKLQQMRETTGLTEAVMTGRVKIGGHSAVIGICDARFLMGSMGSVVGERITQAVERATRERLPLILFCCSGGARMQEGIVSLMQMAKTSAALKRHSDAGLLYISVLTDPTTGGVTASFAMLGDIILAEPGALIGFAGPRVIEQTIKQKLPEGFQRSEFLLEHGFLDAIVERANLKETLGRLLALHKEGEWEDAAEPFLPKKRRRAKITAWEVVERSRQAERLNALDYIEGVFSDFFELHGDRYCRDDGAVVGGIALFQGIPVTVIGQQKGKNLKENLNRNFGMPSPDGYRKALRLMKQAEKFHRPVICLVDTPGAFCGLEAEERGQGRAIAENLFELASLKTPVLSIVIGEGGSGGALALALADEVWMMENAVYSVLSPEGFASILWKDSKRASEAAEVMKMTAEDLKELGVIEKILPEEIPACEENKGILCGLFRVEIRDFLHRYQEFSLEELVERRYQRFRAL